jgi:UDP-N-acetylmuramyl pentapeptide phosphotransferase/UDP-N-acetylglucosamine-1-phosphate transferase
MSTDWLVDNIDNHGYCYVRTQKQVSSVQMHAVLVWWHVGFMMVAFGASPLGRLGLRHLLSRVSGPHSAQAIARAFSRISLIGGLSVTAGVSVGLVLAWDTLLTQTWVTASIALILIAGVAGVAIEDRWLKRLSRAERDAFASVLHEKIPFLAALVSPVIWLFILWLMIEKPA